MIYSLHIGHLFIVYGPTLLRPLLNEIDSWVFLWTVISANVRTYYPIKYKISVKYLIKILNFKETVRSKMLFL